MPSIYSSMTDEQLAQQISELEAQADALAAKGLALDMARGKPSPDQVACSRPMLDVLTSDSDLLDQGVDASNYGFPDGLPSARQLMADILGVDAANVTVGASSSLTLMYGAVSHAVTHGVCGNAPWSSQGEVKFLCPSPGYDRHFAITEHFGITNVAVPMTSEGPDMDRVRELVEGDPLVKGIWCVPKYSNPTGITYSDDVVRAFASLRPAAPDFRIFWDNAYVVHDLVQPGDELLEVFGACAAAGNEDLVYEFASTSKVTFPGSGIACIASSPTNMVDIRTYMGFEHVCPNKMMQLMHVRYLKDLAGVREHMAEQAKVLKPRFDLVEDKLQAGLGQVGCATWSQPRGGYFVSFEGPAHSAHAIVELAAKLGVKMTGAGATWPGGDDPCDTNIRIAPSYPSLDDLGAALDVFVTCVKLVSARLERDAR